MIDCRVFYFAGPPRTGSTWVMHALHACNLPCGSKATVHWPHSSDATKPRVSTVRHPGRWLPSFYAEIGRPALQELGVFAEWQGLDESSFDDFVRSYLEKCPGAIGRTFDAYGADVHWRIEDAPSCMASFLASLDINGAACRNVPPVNCGKRIPAWSPALYRKVMRAEQEMLERFDYGAGGP